MSDFLERCRNGERDARRALYEEYADRVFGLALKILKNRDEAKDAVQQVFVRVFSRIGQFRNQSEIGTWIYRITTNICLDHLKSQSNKTLSMEEDSVKYVAERQYAIDPDQVKSPIEEITRKVLKTIDDGWAKTFWLYTMHGMSQKEIAKIQKISVPTVKMRLARVRKALRERIDKKDL